MDTLEQCSWIFQTLLMAHTMVFFLNFILMYKLKVQIQISLIIGHLYSANLITGISSMEEIMNGWKDDE